MPLDNKAVNTAQSATPQRFLARQPVFNRQRHVIGYELLFRSGWQNFFSGEKQEATRQTLDNYLCMGIESLASGQLAFLNCTYEALVNRWVSLLPPETTVLEILEDIEPTPELIEVCIQLHGQGYRFALDDFVPRPEWAPLLQIASYVKVDFQATDAAQRREIHQMVRTSKAALLAEKVEDQECFNLAVSEGYKFFQGYFFCRPVIMARRELPTGRLNYVRLLAELARENLNLDVIAQIVQLEPSLSYRLLVLANSARWGRRVEVTSVHEAFMWVGERRFRALVAVAASCANSAMPSALVNLSLERARFCELLAPLVGQSPSEQFMLGVLSLLDAIIESPMEVIAKSLPLRAEARAALLGENNAVAVPLNLFRSLEGGAWDACSAASAGLGVSEETLASLYFDSVKWATELVAAS